MPSHQLMVAGKSGLNPRVNRHEARGLIKNVRFIPGGTQSVVFFFSSLAARWHTVYCKRALRRRQMFVLHIFHTVSIQSKHSKSVTFKIKKLVLVIRTMKVIFSWPSSGFSAENKTNEMFYPIKSTPEGNWASRAARSHLQCVRGKPEHSPVLAGHQLLRRPYVTLSVPPGSSLLLGFISSLCLLPPSSSLCLCCYHSWLSVINPSV